MEAAIQHEGSIAGAGICRIIIGKFSYRQKLCPVILLVFNKDLQVGLHCTILRFNLAISLGVEGGKESSLDT